MGKVRVAITSDVIPEMTWPNEEMSLAERRAAFGQVVRAHRERAGISLVSLAQATRISVSFLEAIEVGQVDKLPGQVFGRGFLRSICTTIQVPALLFLEAFDLCWEGEHLMAPPKLNKTKAERKAEAKSPRPWLIASRMRSWRWEVVVGALIVIVAVVVSLYVDKNDERTSKSRAMPKAALHEAVTKPRSPAADKTALAVAPAVARPQDRPTVQALTDPTNPAVVEQKKSSPQSAQPKLVAKQEPAPAQPKLTAASAKFEQVLELKVTQPVRIKIATDKDGMVTKELKPDTYRFRFEDSADLLIYDAAALDVSFNGRSLGPLGNKGRVRRFTFEAKPDEQQIY